MAPSLKGILQTDHNDLYTNTNTASLPLIVSCLAAVLFKSSLSLSLTRET